MKIIAVLLFLFSKLLSVFVATKFESIKAGTYSYFVFVGLSIYLFLKR